MGDARECSDIPDNQILVSNDQSVRFFNHRPRINVIRPRHAALAQNNVGQGNFQVKHVCKEVIMRNDTGSAISQDIDSPMIIPTGKLVSFDKQAPLSLAGDIQKPVRIRTNRLGTDDVQYSGITKLRIGIDGLAELSETRTENNAQERITRARIGCQPSN